MKFEVKVDHLLTPTLSRAFNRHRQSFAQTVPYILEDLFPNLKVVHLEKGKVVMEDINGEHLKVVCSSDGKYDVYPSFTKGFNRSKTGVSVKDELSKICDKLLFVDIAKVGVLGIRAVELAKFEIPEKGVVSFE